MAYDSETLGAAIGICGVGGGDITALEGRVSTIEGKIPSEASSTNKLADKAYVNDAIENNIGSAVSDWLDDNVDPETGYVLDYSLSIKGAAADAKATGDTVAELKSAIANNAISALLHAEEIENTVQSILFDESGNVQSITHIRDNVAVRTDAFTFATNSITEVRTLNTGESLTIVTNTATLQTTVTYTAA